MDNYWNRKVELTAKAKSHTKLMEDKYKDEIEMAINNTVIFDKFEDEVNNIKTKYTKISVLDTDSVGAIFTKQNGSKIAVLNFASYKNPGGMFVNGSSAQEECLCHASFLYNVLLSFTKTFYEPNRLRLNKALYNDNLLYSKDVRFFLNKSSVLCDVITCAAPNAGAARKYAMVSESEINNALLSRCDSVLYAAYKNNVKTLILGAFGCGVFCNNPETVAKIFKNLLSDKYSGVFDEVVFAIPKSSKNNNIGEFSKVFCSDLGKDGE